MRITVKAILFLWAAGVGLPALAQGPGPSGPGADMTVDERRTEMRQRIRVMRAWRLTEELDLDEETGIELFAHLDAFDTRVEADQQQLSELGRQLRTFILEGTGSDEEVRAIMGEIMAAHLRIEQARIEMIEAAGTFLTAHQQAALMLFLPEFDDEIRDTVREARRGRRGRGRDGAGPGPLALPPDGTPPPRRRPRGAEVPGAPDRDPLPAHFDSATGEPSFASATGEPIRRRARYQA